MSREVSTGRSGGIIIEATLIDKISAKASVMSNNLKAKMDSANKSLSSVSNTSTLVSKNTGAMLGAMNEKTEKFRQLTMLAGNEMTNQAAQAIYYGGTIFSLVGKINLFEGVLVGATLAAVALGAAIFKMSTHDIDKFNEETIESFGVLSDFKKKHEELNKTLIAELRGWDKTKTLIHETNLALGEINKTRSRFLEDAKDTEEALSRDLGYWTKLAFSMSVSGGAMKDLQEVYKVRLRTFDAEAAALKSSMEGNEKLNDAIKKGKKIKAEAAKEEAELAKRVAAQREASLQAKKEALAREDQAEKEATAKLAAELKQREADNQAYLREYEAGKAEQARIDAEFESFQSDFINRQIAAQEKLTSKIIDFQDRAAQRQIEIFDETMQKQQETIDGALAVADAFANTAIQMIELFDVFGAAAEENEEKKRRKLGQEQALVAGVNMAMEVAHAAAAYAKYDIVGGIAHTLAAGLYGAVMGKAIDAATGGGGSTSGTGGGGSSGGTTGPIGPTAEEVVEGAQQQVVINVYGHQFFSDEANKQLNDMVNDYRDKQNPGAERNRL